VVSEVLIAEIALVEAGLADRLTAPLRELARAASP
jgi:hypothetical protein